MACPRDDAWWSQFQLSSLPVDCLAVVFSLCTPRDVGRLASVNRSWKTAAESDEAWSRTLAWKPPLSPSFPDLSSTSLTAKQLFKKALKGLLSFDRHTLLTVDPHSGLPSFHFSAVQNFAITWLDKTESDTRYWKIKRDVQGSDFDRCAYLKSVCWFEMDGDLKLPFHVPPGSYTLYWKVAREPGSFQWDDPAKCTVTGSTGDAPIMIHEVPVDFNTRGQSLKATGVPLKSTETDKTSDLNAEEYLEDLEVEEGENISDDAEIEGVPERDAARAVEALAGVAASQELAQAAPLFSGVLSAAAEVLRHAVQAPPSHPVTREVHFRVGPGLVVHPNEEDTAPANTSTSDEGVGSSTATSSAAELNVDNEGAAPRTASFTAPSGSGVGIRPWNAPNWYRLMPQRAAPPRKKTEKFEWELFRVGEISVIDNGAFFSLHVNLAETKSGWWKSGLYVDSFVLSHC